MPSPPLNHVPKHHVYTFSKYLQGISLKLQLSPLCQDFTLLYEVSLPKKSTDRMLKYKLSQQLFLLLNYLYKPAATERGFILIGKNKVLFLINKMNGFLELVISGILTLYVLWLLGRLAGGKGQRSYQEI